MSDARTHGAYWRSLEERIRATDPRSAGLEFPPADADADGVSRREFLHLLGASAALAGLGACMQPAENILPYVTQPPELTPGLPLWYATSMELDGFATGLIVESHAGRPTKIEGNPEHPASRGAAGVYEQASLLQLYDPHRATSVRAPAGAAATWRGFRDAIAPGGRLPGDGAGTHLLLQPTSSPLLGELVRQLRRRYPALGITFYAPLSHQASLASRSGRPLLPQHDFRAANVVLALDADFLGGMPNHLRYARDFADRRRITAPGDSMNRLYVVEPMPTVTGNLADHRFRARAGDIPRILAALLAELARAGVASPRMPAEVDALSRDVPLSPEIIRAIARDLTLGGGRSIVIAGPRQPAGVHALTHLLNATLRNIGRTVWYSGSPVVEAGEPSHSVQPLLDAMRAGAVRTLLILEGNPVHNLPAEMEFSRLLRAVPNTAYLGLFENETATHCDWMIPAAQYLEAWGDARACDGTVSIVQPLIRPMYGGRTPAEVCAALMRAEDESILGLVRARWSGSGDDGRTWMDVLRRGVVPDSAFAAEDVAADSESMSAGVRALAALTSRPLEIVFQQDPAVYDGRFTNNPWLLELPDPITKLTWDNAALLSPATGARSQVETGDMVTVRLMGRAIRLPVLLVPGHADDAVTVRLGYGRDGSEAIARGVGVNAYMIWPASMPYAAGGVTLERVLDGDAPVRHALALTQTHWSLEGRSVVKEATLDAYRQDPDFTRAHHGRVLSLYEPYEYETGDQWAMAIDLATCTGCNACVVACQAENNIPTVGKAEVLKSREMHWLRIDRYLTGDSADPSVVTQPMLCQHCEKAPCEYVCPVNATVHSSDGLNEMVYNRCVGTRFCSNNCPYKVRRFNWFDYNAEITETERMAKNPDVTVRERGVMEKCTFCVQRIRQAQIGARLEERSVRDGEVVTACQQACPTRAIVFGSRTDPSASIVQRLAERRRFSALAELGTQPRVHYLARITNPNPALDPTA